MRKENAMYYADEPRNERTRLPMSKEIRTLGLISGIALIFMPFLFVLTLNIGAIFVFPSLLTLDITALVICFINPATPKRKTACKVTAIIGCVIALAWFVYFMLVVLGYLPQSFMITV